MTSDSSTFNSWLESQLSATQEALKFASKGSSLCQIDRQGQSTNSLKTLQGHEYAYRLAYRFRQQPASEFLKSIESKLAYQEQLRAGVCQNDPAWLAYTEAAIESFSEILAKLADNR